jgi:hypothetical protein
MGAHTVIEARPAHSEWGGSIAARWINCPGSVALLRHIPRRPGGEAAAEGTWMHAIAAYCLNEGRSATSLVHTSLPFGVEVPEGFFGRIIDADIAAAVDVYVDAVLEEVSDDENAILLVEEPIELPIGDDGEVFSRLDAVVWHPTTRRLRLFDFKGGKGIVVEVEDNDQGREYLVGVLHKHPDWEPETAIFTIVQPRPWAVDAGKLAAVRDEQIMVADLSMWLDTARNAYDASKDWIDVAEEAVMLGVPVQQMVSNGLSAGPWCGKSFCDAQAICPKQEQAALAAAGLAFKDVTLVTTDVLPDVKSLDIDRLEAVASAAGLLAAYAGKCLEYLESLAMGGHPTKRFKLVEKIGRRKYVVDDAEIVDFLDMSFDIPGDVSTRTLLQTLTEMKKILKQHGATKEQIDDFELRFTLKESSGLTLAPISDKRPAAAPVATSFGDVNIPAVP